MTFRTNILLLAAGFLFVALGAQAAPEIQFWSNDGDYAICNLTIPNGESRTWRVVAHPDGLTGILGATLRLTGAAGYVHVVTPNPSNSYVIGDLLSTGVSIGFPSCEAGPTVVLFSVQTTNVGGGPSSMQLVPHTNASGPTPCAYLVSCEDSFTEVCVPAATMGVNQGYGTAPDSPSPADGATEVATTAQLAWSGGHPGSECAIGIAEHRVYFGTSTNPPFAGTVGSLDNTVWDPGALQPNTTYHWRVESIDTGFGIAGPLWSFTTPAAVAVETVQWSIVKRRFR